MNYTEWLAWRNFKEFLIACKIARETGKYVLPSRGTKTFYTLVDKKTYDKAWEKYGRRYTFKHKFNDYIVVPLDYKNINQDIYIGDLEIKVPLYSGTINLKEFMKEDKNGNENNS